MSSDEAEDFNFDGVSFIPGQFTFIAFCIPSKKYLPTPTLQKYCPVFSQKLYKFIFYAYVTEVSPDGQKFFKKMNGLCISWISLWTACNSLRVGHLTYIIKMIISSIPALKSSEKMNNYTERTSERTSFGNLDRR